MSVKPAGRRIDLGSAEDRLSGLGAEADNARHLDERAEAVTATIVSLSPLTAGMAIDYIDRLARPIPSLSAKAGVEIVTRAYAAHLAVEEDPQAFGAPDVPVLGSFPPLRHGRPPQDIITRAVRASRRNFPAIRAVSAPVWEGFVVLLTRRLHAPVEDDEDLVAIDVVDGLARFGWVLRQIDIHYKLSPELRS